NLPVAAQDVLTTSEGRAEIELADGSGVFLDADTRVEFHALTDAGNAGGQTTVLVLEKGALRLDVGDPPDGVGTFEIDRGARSVSLLSAGSCRIDVRGGVTTFSSYHGAAEFAGDEGSVLLRSGQRSVVLRERAPSEPRRLSTASTDAFDRF